MTDELCYPPCFNEKNFHETIIYYIKNPTRLSQTYDA